MAPTEQGLDADQPAAPSFDLGLVVKNELVFIDRLAQLSQERKPLGRMEILVVGVEVVADASRLGRVHGDIGPLHQRIDIVTLFRA